MSEVDPQLRSFIEEIADTSVKRDLIIYFHENPAIDNCRGLATWTNHSEEDIVAEIDSLVSAGILARAGEGASAVYCYQPSSEMKDLVQRFVSSWREDRSTVDDELERLRSEMERMRRESLRELHREQSKMRVIVQSMADGIVVTDADDVVVLCNPAAARLMGSDSARAIGKNIADCLPSDDWQPLADEIADVRDPTVTSLSTEITLESEVTRSLRALVSSVRGSEGDFLGAVVVLQDISDVKELDVMRGEFVSMVSHELRSPLTSIKGFTTSMMRGVFGEMDEKQLKALEIVAQQSDRLLGLINDLLDLARADAGPASHRMEEIQLADVLRKVAETMRPQADEKAQELIATIPDVLPIIQADPDNMEQVFVNLVSNAIKYSPDGRRVELSADEQGDYVRVIVADNGMGIPAESLAQIFDRFYRVKDERTREITGTGLGLSIVKTIIDAHHGHISVDSEVDVGTRFTVLLPKPGAATVESPAETVTADASGAPS